MGFRGPTLTRIGLEFLWTGPRGVLVNGPSRVSIWGSCGQTLTGSGSGVPVDGPSQGSIWGSCGRTLVRINLGFLWTDPHRDRAVEFLGTTLVGIDLGFLWWTDPCRDQAVWSS